MPSRLHDERSSGERIAKLLARAGVASRREVERMIAEGRVTRDGVPVDTPATVLPSLAGIAVDGQPVAAAEPARLFLYHKPPGLLVTERDPRRRPTIYDRLPAELPRVVPVGRLDLNTEGLLLLTTDGGLKRRLELPSSGVPRTYRARAYGQVSQPQLETLIDGIEIDGIRYGSIDANLERRTGANQWIELTLAEGKNREVRRVLEHLGLEVSRLIRVRYGPFVLGDLPAGAVGEVRAADLAQFTRALEGGAARTAEPIAVAPGQAGTRRRTAASLQPRATVMPEPVAGREAASRVSGSPARPATTAESVPPGARPEQPGLGRRPARAAGTGAGTSPLDERRRPRTDVHQGKRADRTGAVADAAPSDDRRRPRAIARPEAAANRTGASATQSPDRRQPRTQVRPENTAGRTGDASPSARSSRGRAAPPADAEPGAASPRPTRPPARKPGWARPKPKPGPKRPRR